MKGACLAILKFSIIKIEDIVDKINIYKGVIIIYCIMLTNII